MDCCRVLPKPTSKAESTQGSSATELLEEDEKPHYLRSIEVIGEADNRLSIEDSSVMYGLTTQWSDWYGVFTLGSNPPAATHFSR